MKPLCGKYEIDLGNVSVLDFFDEEKGKERLEKFSLLLDKSLSPMFDKSWCKTKGYVRKIPEYDLWYVRFFRYMKPFSTDVVTFGGTWDDKEKESSFYMKGCSELEIDETTLFSQAEKEIFASICKSEEVVNKDALVLLENLPTHTLVRPFYLSINPNNISVQDFVSPLVNWMDEGKYNFEQADSPNYHLLTFKELDGNFLKVANEYRECIKEYLKDWKPTDSDRLSIIWKDDINHTVTNTVYLASFYKDFSVFQLYAERVRDEDGKDTFTVLVRGQVEQWEEREILDLLVISSKFIYFSYEQPKDISADKAYEYMNKSVQSLSRCNSCEYKNVKLE